MLWLMSPIHETRALRLVVIFAYPWSYHPSPKWPVQAEDLGRRFGPTIRLTFGHEVICLGLAVFNLHLLICLHLPIDLVLTVIRLQPLPR